jgi:hypothetical protein
MRSCVNKNEAITYFIVKGVWTEVSLGTVSHARGTPLFYHSFMPLATARKRDSRSLYEKLSVPQPFEEAGRLVTNTQAGLGLAVYDILFSAGHVYSTINTPF